MMLDTIRPVVTVDYTGSISQQEVSSASGVPSIGHGDTVIVQVRSGCTITGTTSIAALDCSLTDSKDLCYVVNNGLIYGEGGAGGAHCNSGIFPSGGAAGGDALLTTTPLKVDNQGTVGGGGGGNGGNGCNSSGSSKGCDWDVQGGSAASGIDGSGINGSTGATGTGCAGIFGGAGGGIAGDYINGSANTTWITTGIRLGNTS